MLFQVASVEWDAEAIPPYSSLVLRHSSLDIRPFKMVASVFIVEDHAVMRRMLHEYVKRQDWVVCGEAETGEAALEQLDEAGANLVLVDVSLPKMSGIELAKKIQARWPGLRCLMLSGHGQASYVEQALAAGACGYVLKGNPHEIAEAMRQVLAGEVYLSEELRVEE